ncbi:MAG: class 1 fructose-bisphosphatase [Phycisphaerae bacterium]|nr:class 1 fructose-bisphosphatase [Phycisphaerae bacterium]
MAERDPDQIITIQQHIIEQQRKHPTASGEFSWLLSGITLAASIIQAKVRRAGLINILGETDTDNVHGERQQKLDIFANQIIERCLAFRGNVGVLGSEELPEPIIVHSREGHGKYVVLFDPLDGSGNIDVNVSVGTIFSIYERVTSGPITDGGLKDVLQPGVNQLAAGYIVYGSSTVMAYTTGDGVHLFTLDPATGSFMLADEHVRIPENGKIYSVNEANFDSFPKGVQDWIHWARTKEAGPFTSRYIGSMVADVHRTLIKGGVFMYPATAKSPKGKLRLMYEANPMAFIIEQAGGLATDGKNRIMERVPTELHERTPLFIGGKHEVTAIMERLARG